MFDKLLEFISQLGKDVLPFVIINQTRAGVRLSGGKYKKTLDPGVHFKIPLYDEIIDNTIVWTTVSLNSQSLTTKDGKDIVVKGIIKYRVADVKIFALEVWDSIDAISDMTQGIIFDIVKNKTWEECQAEDLKTQITRKARVEARRWGIEIETVTLSDLAKIRSIRLLNDAGSLG